MTRQLKPYLPGLLLLCLAQYLVETQTALLTDWFEFLKWSGYGLLLITLGMSVHFNRPFYAHTTILLGIQYYLVQTYLQAPSTELDVQAQYVWLALWFPISLLIVSLMPSKPVMHVSQAVTVALYLALLAWPWLDISSYSDWYYGMLIEGGVKEQLLQLWPVPWSVSSMAIWGSYILALSAALGLAHWMKLPKVLPILVVAGFILNLRFHLPYESTLMVLAAVLSLLIYLMQQSWQLVYLDELTGLPGRRALNETMQGLGRKYTIAMMDVDHFKKFNDTYGHDIGDQVLRMVAARINEVTGGGKPFRYGGEEFSIVFSGKSVDQTLAHLEAVRTAIQNYQLTIRQSDRPEDHKEGKKQRKGKTSDGTEQVSVTISIGVAERTSDDKDPNVVLKNADKALYRAKESGRNCVCQ
ncbi:GGDEF domain-containing protein [Litoribrevibacter albus]|uniref:diguanylate cyclase n=1 Tax=Litoribrevibacter albus TaxID=1473156 RepID=A0AA37W761_9GAMM|nr:GGDEF domain-containing protein [Litoribrevibacter albus]GLQ32095.1 GGDEF domain-containing protein [Litoribrevibacter albus]